MTIHAALMAISPLDGRYQEKTAPLRTIFSEFGLMKCRVTVEIQWLLMLTEATLPAFSPLPPQSKQLLNHLIEDFSLTEAARIKEIEASINHDVKAVEYFIKERISDDQTLASLSEYIHFGCTSEDINNLAYALMLKTARTQCMLPALEALLSLLRQFAHQYASLPMLARTHGQPASPTTVGKEIANVIARLQRQTQQLADAPILGKLNGASGNYNAMKTSFPEIDWQLLSKNFIHQLGLTWNPYTTQIEPHDALAEFFSILIRINTILIDFSRDIWGYIAIHYFKLKSVDHEVGSSTMPHKINPIDFENAEGNLGIANALLTHMITKLPVSRWQRDLTDSTVLRNMGVAMGHGVLAYFSIHKGMLKLAPNTDVIEKDLDNHWEVLAEAVQTMMRRYGIDQPYEKLKSFTRGKQIDKLALQQFIQGLDIPDQAKHELLMLTPATYTGYAEDLAKRI